MTNQNNDDDFQWAGCPQLSPTCYHNIDPLTSPEGGELSAPQEPFQRLHSQGSIRINRTLSQVRSERSQRASQEQAQRSASLRSDPPGGQVADDDDFREVNLSVEEDNADPGQGQRAMDQGPEDMGGQEDGLQHDSDHNRRQGLQESGGIEVFTGGKLTIYFSMMLALKVWLLDGTDGYFQMQIDHPRLFKLYSLNIPIFAINILLRAVGYKCSYTRKRANIYVVIVLIHGFLTSIFGFYTYFSLKFNTEFYEYFQEDSTMVFHQSCTLTLIEVFRSPLLLYVGLILLLLCCLAVVYVSTGETSFNFSFGSARQQQDQAPNAEEQGFVGQLRRSATAFLDQRSRPYQQKYDSLTSCPICMVDFTEEGEELVAELDCNNQHIFHVQCIKDWLNQNQTCPVCRHDVVIEPILVNE